MLRTPCTWVTQHRHLKLAVTWELHSYLLAFTLVGSVVHNTAGKKIVYILPSGECWELQK